MGSELHLLAEGAGAERSIRAAIAEIGELEQRWSRFRPGSELCRLNAASGSAIELSEVTFDAVCRAVQAWRDTYGYFDPTVLPALERAGYDRSFDQLAPSGGAGDDPGTVAGLPSPGCAGIVLDAASRTVLLPPGVRLDLGGIGKGLAADRVLELMLDAGAEGALVNIGGDVRVGGVAPSPEGWLIDVDDRALVSLSAGAVVTSSVARRRWLVRGRSFHHLIDPATGLPAESGLMTVAVLGASAGSAEVVAKASLIAGERVGSSLIAEHGMAALLVGSDGISRRVGGFEAFELPVPVVR
jgi:thiamine biosynthesis lipoprotein